MSENPLVSVTIAVYNGEKYLPDLLDSVLRQSYPNIEIVAVDDKSTDGSLNILNEYRVRYRNIRVFENGSNLGYIKNFERAFTLASGEYVAPADQDDIWHPEKISRLMREIERGYNIAFCDSEFADKQGNPTGVLLSDKKRQIDFDRPLMFAVGNSAPGHAMIVEKNIIRECLPFPESMVYDRWIGFVGTFHGPMKFVDIPLVKYRQHDTNITSGTEEAKRARKAKKQTDEKIQARDRMRLFYEKCPPGEQKEVFRKIYRSYCDFSFLGRLKRVGIFMAHRDDILAWKRRSSIRKVLFCFKMFFKVV